MRIISVVSGKGGVGKTTIASNLGVVLTKEFKKKVIAVDCNLTTSHLGFYLGMEYTPVTLNHVLKGEAEMNEAMYNHQSGLSVIPSSSSLGDIKGVDPSHLESVINKFHSRYVGRADFMILDCAPGMSREAFSGVNASDEILFVTIPYMPAVMDVIRFTHLIRDSGVRHAGVVVNMTERGKHQLSSREIERLVGLPVIGEIPTDNNIPESLSKRTPVVVANPGCRASKNIKILASNLLKESIVHPSYRRSWHD